MLAETPRVLRLVWDANRGFAAALVGLTAIQALEPVAQVWITKLIVDNVVSALQAPPTTAETDTRSAILTASGAPVMGFVALLALVKILGSVMEPAGRFVSLQLADHLTRDLNSRILHKANSLVDVSFFENPRFYDFLQRAENQASYRPIAMLEQLANLLRNLIGISSMLLVLATLHVLLAVAVISLALPHLFLQFRHQRQNWALTNFQVPEVRRMRYISGLLTGNLPAKEVRLFGLGDYLLGQYLGTFEAFHQRYRTLRLAQWRWNTLLAVASAGGTSFVYAYIVIQALLGRITIGELLLYTGAVAQVQLSLWAMIWSLAALYEANLFGRDLFDFLSLPLPMSPLPPGIACPVPSPWRAGVEFRQVSFRYPGTGRYVLRDVSFTIHPQQTVALVGENGAGKSTLVKLLTRLYDPTEGRILVDGLDLRDYDLEAWRRQIGVIFQDFGTYHLTAGENIGIGDVDRVSDPAAVRLAAERGGAASVITRLPNGYDTPLIRWVSGTDDGFELSGGEWQRIALARAFMRITPEDHADCSHSIEHSSNGASPTTPDPSGAQLLILDEPTSALDAETESDIYRNFQQLTRGRAALLISHRFAAVKMVDMILVLKDGSIVEQGTHDELMRLGGRYAGLYTMQAERYRS
ncbi:MAG TPA: ABC transporter ATP-binding protein [Chloroflexota bacterium]|nr:ABC transporter ATP-binding protein [Chloroflexota bacterium]